MTKSYDELMKILEEKGEIPDADAKKIIEANGPLTDDEKKSMAAAIKMRKLLKSDSESADKKPMEAEKDAEKKAAAKKDDSKETKADDKNTEEKKADADEEVTMEAYISALSVLDSEDASEEEKKAAEKIKAKFES